MRLQIIISLLISALPAIASSPLTHNQLMEASETIGNPDFPDYDEEAYCKLLNQALGSPLIEEADKLRASSRLEIAKKNRVGSIASNFEFITRNGYSTNLDDIKSHKPILLIFYDPDCSHCNEIFDELKHDETTEKKITVVAIDAEDDREIWQETSANLPSDWMVGFAETPIQDEEIYVFLTSPTIYLLSPDKKIILKDATLDRIKKTLQ